MVAGPVQRGVWRKPSISRGTRERPTLGVCSVRTLHALRVCVGVAAARRPCLFGGSCSGRPRARLRPCRQHSRVGTRRSQTHTRRTLRTEQSRGRGAALRWRCVRRVAGGQLENGGARARAPAEHTQGRSDAARQRVSRHATRTHAHTQTQCAHPCPSVCTLARADLTRSRLAMQTPQQRAGVRPFQQALDGCILACGALLLLWRSGLRRRHTSGQRWRAWQRSALTWIEVCTTLARLLGHSSRHCRSRRGRGAICLGLAARGAGTPEPARAVVLDCGQPSAALVAARLARRVHCTYQTRRDKRGTCTQRCTAHRNIE